MDNGLRVRNIIRGKVSFPNDFDIRGCNRKAALSVIRNHDASTTPDSVTRSFRINKSTIIHGRSKCRLPNLPSSRDNIIVKSKSRMGAASRTNFYIAAQKTLGNALGHFDRSTLQNINKVLFDEDPIPKPIPSKNFMFV